MYIGPRGECHKPENMTAALDFESAVREALGYLKENLGFDQWLVTRFEDSECIVMESLENHPFQVGHTFE